MRITEKEILIPMTDPVWKKVFDHTILGNRVDYGPEDKGHKDCPICKEARKLNKN